MERVQQGKEDSNYNEIEITQEHHWALNKIPAVKDSVH